MPDSDALSIRDLGPMVRARRATLGLRETAKQIGGVSASTLSRVEQGNVPDLDTFARLCRWLEVSPDRFIRPAGDQVSELESGDRKDIITAHLRADRTLDPETADALTKMIRLAYDAAQQEGESEGETD